MRVVGVVCEYNPFHKGHEYHLNETRRLTGGYIVAVMSGSFVQRGEPAMLDKFERAETAVRCGADLVLELPLPYCLSSAEFFARGAVSVLSGLGCVDTLSFGSECGDIELLRNAAAAAEEVSRSEELKRRLSDGQPYPAALQEMISEKYGSIASIFSQPNNLLGIEYIKALCDIAPEIEPITIKRQGAQHDSETADSEFISAAMVRKKIALHEDVTEYLPPAMSAAVLKAAEQGEICELRRLERTVLYRLRTAAAEELAMLPDVTGGLENRLISAASARSYRELIEKLSTKRYPTARLRRILMNMLIGTKAEDCRQSAPYARVLALNERGCEILSHAKGTLKIPCSTSLGKLSRLSPAAERFSLLESGGYDISMLSRRNIGTTGLDFTRKITKTITEDL